MNNCDRCVLGHYEIKKHIREIACSLLPDCTDCSNEVQNVTSLIWLVRKENIKQLECLLENWNDEKANSILKCSADLMYYIEF